MQIGNNNYKKWYDDSENNHYKFIKNEGTKQMYINNLSGIY